MRIVSLIDDEDVIERTLRHLGLWQEGVRVRSGSDPPGETTLDPLARRPLPQLRHRTDHGVLRHLKRPSPIGFYFAKLWYYEQLYPMISTVAALPGPGITPASADNSKVATLVRALEFCQPLLDGLDLFRQLEDRPVNLVLGFFVAQR